MLNEYTAVRVWVDAVSCSQGDARLEVLKRFAQQTGVTPDAMIADCLRPLHDGQKKLNFKARRRWVDEIASFEAANGGRPTGNVIRSFFIQNGVPIQSSILN